MAGCNLPDEIIKEILSPVLNVSDDTFRSTAHVSPFSGYNESTSALLVVCKTLERALRANNLLGTFIKKLRVEGGFGGSMDHIIQLAPNINGYLIVARSSGSPTEHSSLHSMDSFTAITIPGDSQPTNQEDGGTGNTVYCVVFAKDNVPAEQEDGGTGNTSRALHESKTAWCCKDNWTTPGPIDGAARIRGQRRATVWQAIQPIPPSNTRLASSSPTMDSFTDVAAYIDNIPPTNEEDGGTGNTTYCVVFAKEDLPSNEEDGGTGNTTYCVVA
ncbi:hypothetical protein FPV67DRAFT_1672026 [Lyophyllum atratum]|nr:hypothetical protein FPV67DRAFT_1672026 [Lyophyllum atratum]